MGVQGEGGPPAGAGGLAAALKPGSGPQRLVAAHTAPCQPAPTCHDCWNRVSDWESWASRGATLLSAPSTGAAEAGTTAAGT